MRLNNIAQKISHCKKHKRRMAFATRENLADPNKVEATDFVFICASFYFSITKMFLHLFKLLLLQVKPKEKQHTIFVLYTFQSIGHFIKFVVCIGRQNS